ncbi:MAG: hypothetical protein EBZ48_13090, partial [Proteobacteria bacterium]|nr:hypothetical protein [Pseudomonadota bacterium]
YIGEISSLHRTVDELVLADGVKPIRFGMSQGTVTYTTNAPALDTYLSDLLTKLRSRVDLSQPYRMELQYQVLSINQSTGAFGGFQASSGNTRIEGGFAGTTPICPEMGAMLSAAATTQGAGGVAAFAVPRPPSGYLPISVIMGVRVLRDLSATGVGQLYSFVNQQPLIVASCKVLFLRGDVEG